MAQKKKTADDRVEQLLSKILALNLWLAGAPQSKIARALGKSKQSVNEFLKGIPRAIRGANQ
jgi:hypothetical protein